MTPDAHNPAPRELSSLAENPSLPDGRSGSTGQDPSGSRTGAAPASTPERPLLVAHSEFRGRRVLAIARKSLTSPSAPGRWLVGLRWIALAGMLATVFVASRLVPDLDVVPLYLLIGLLALVNVCWMVLVRRDPEERIASIGAQIAVDVVALGAILWFSGGVTNPFAGFLIFHIVLAGLLGSRGTALFITVLAVAASVALAFARPLSNPGTEALYYGHFVALVALGAFTGVFVLLIANRLSTLRAEATRTEKLAALGRQMAAMSHELNTPLGTILLASRELVELGEEAQRVDIVLLARTISDEARRSSDIIGLMRGYVRADARAETVDLGTFVESWAERELDRAGFTGTRRYFLPQGVVATLLTVALRQILTNVLMNAVDALKGTPNPTLVIRLLTGPEGPTLLVEDNGTGVSPAIAPHLGEPFLTTKEAEGGMGLGLFVSTRLAERMGATLSIESAPIRGTRVLLHLPADALEAGDTQED